MIEANLLASIIKPVRCLLRLSVVATRRVLADMIDTKIGRPCVVPRRHNAIEGRDG